jgi:hypothetical protein
MAWGGGGGGVAPVVWSGRGAFVVWGIGSALCGLYYVDRWPGGLSNLLQWWGRCGGGSMVLGLSVVWCWV